MNKTFYGFLGMFLSMILNANAGINTSCMATIADVETKFEKLLNEKIPLDDILVVFDWDETINKNNGAWGGFREGDVTKNLLEYLSGKEANVMILTAKNGPGVTPLYFDPNNIYYNDLLIVYGQPKPEAVKQMLEKIIQEKLPGENWKCVLKKDELKDFAIKITESKLDTSAHVFLKNCDKNKPLVVACPGEKGKSMENLLNNGNVTAKHIIFVDNKEAHIIEFEEAFKEDKHKDRHFYLYHYPIAGEKAEHKQRYCKEKK